MRYYSQTFCFCTGLLDYACVSLLKPDIQPNRENRMWRLRLLSVHFSGIVNASAVFQPVIGGRVRHLQWGRCSLIKSMQHVYLTNKSICKDSLISHHSGIFRRSNSWRHYLFPNASVKNKEWIKCTTFCPMLLNSEKKVLIRLVGPLAIRAAQ